MYFHKVHHALSFCLFLLSSLVYSEDVTVDDTSDSITYSPADDWNQGNGCTSCSASPTASSAHGSSWHDTTYQAGDTAHTITYEFTGTGIAAYFIVPDIQTGDLTLTTNLTFSLDDSTVGTYSHSPTGGAEFLYNQECFSKQGLSDGSHTLVISANAPSGQSSLVLFDYLVYTTSDQTSSSSSTPTSSTTSSTSVSSSSTQTSNSGTTSGTSSSSTSKTSGSSTSSSSATVLGSTVTSESSATLTSGSVTGDTSNTVLAGSGSQSTDSADSSSGSNTTESSSSNVGAIVGGAVGGTAAIFILVALLLCCRKRRRDSADTDSTWSFLRKDPAKSKEITPLVLEENRNHQPSTPIGFSSPTTPMIMKKDLHGHNRSGSHQRYTDPISPVTETSDSETCVLSQLSALQAHVLRLHEEVERHRHHQPDMTHPTMPPPVYQPRE